MASRQIPEPGSAAEALLRLGRLSLRELSMDSLLQTVAEQVAAVLPGPPEASVTLVVKGAASTAASTSALALDLDERQYEYNQGPCLHAALSGEATEVADTRTDRRWPDYAREAAERGALSSLSLPLVIDEEEGVFGSLNLYARAANGFGDEGRSTVLAFGPYAAVAAGNVYALQNARTAAQNLQAALETRAVIEQAKGILMERYKLTADHAFRLLAVASMNANRKLRHIAQDLVSTGELPVALPGGDRRGPQRSRGRRDREVPEHS